MVLGLASRMLGKLGFEVTAVESPEKALRLALDREGRFDLLMTDIIMPEMNGEDLAEGLRKVSPDIRVLFMSGYCAEVVSQRQYRLNEVAFLAKPYTLYQLSAKLREALA